MEWKKGFADFCLPTGIFHVNKHAGNTKAEKIMVENIEQMEDNPKFNDGKWLIYLQLSKKEKWTQH